MNVVKTRKKEYLKTHIGLSSCDLTNTCRLALQAGFIGACQLSPQEDNVEIQNFSFLGFAYQSYPEYIFSRDLYVMPSRF